MGTEYYGILYEDDNTVIAMKVSRNIPSEDVVESCLPCVTHILDILHDNPVDKLPNQHVVQKLKDIVKDIDNCCSINGLFYLLLMRDKKPRIISEYELFEYIEEKLGKNVVVLGWE